MTFASVVDTLETKILPMAFSLHWTWVSFLLLGNFWVEIVSSFTPIAGNAYQSHIMALDWISVDNHRRIRTSTWQLLASSGSLSEATTKDDATTNDDDNNNNAAIDSMIESLDQESRKNSNSAKVKTRKVPELSKYYKRYSGDDMDRPIPDPQGLRDLLEQRYHARRDANYTKVNDIDKVLKRKHKVRAYDGPNVWTTGSKPPPSYLRRRAARKAQEMKRIYGPTGHNYQQVGGDIDPIVCPLSRADIHDFLSRRLQARLENRFEDADTMLFELSLNYVAVSDHSLCWRADGKMTFDDIDTDELLGQAKQQESMIHYEESEFSQGIVEQFGKSTSTRVKQLIGLRTDAKIRGEDILCQFLSYEIFKTYGIGIDDESQTWSFPAHFGDESDWEPPTLPRNTTPKPSARKEDRTFPPMISQNPEKLYASPTYPQSPDSENISNSLLLDRIEHLVQARVHLRDEHKFAEADSIRQELWETYSVSVRDKAREWCLVGTGSKGNKSDAHFTQAADSQQVPLDVFEEIEPLIRYLESTRMGRNQNAAKPIVQRLCDQYGVIVDEERMEWYIPVSTSGASAYVPYGPVEEHFSSKQIATIQALVDRRHEEILKSNTQVADTIAQGLWRKYQVVINDALCQWETFQ